MTVVTAVTALATAIGADIKDLKTNKAPAIGTPTQLTGDTTVPLSASGTTLIWNGTTTITLTFPFELPTGFKCKVCQSNTGTINFSFPSRTVFGNAYRAGTTYLWDTVDIEMVTVNSFPVAAMIFPIAGPTLFAQASAGLTLTTTTMTNVAGAVMTLEPGVYDIDVRCMYSAAVVSTAGLKIGFAALSSDCIAQLEYRVATTNAGGTAPWRTGFMYGYTAASLVSSAANATVATTKLLATITGRITIPSNPVTLQLQVGNSVASTTNTLTVTAIDTSLSAVKVYG